MKPGFYLEMIRTVFLAGDAEGKLKNRVVVFTSATPGEGVSYVVDLVAKELAVQTGKRVLRMDAGVFQKLDLSDPKLIAKCCEETEIENLLTLSVTQVSAREPALAAVGAAARAGNEYSLPEYRAEYLKALRWNFDYILIDCPAAASSSDAVALAPLVDGVSIVVKAAQTRRAQIQRVHKMIEDAGGEFLGFVLNQRRYPMPGWLYRRL
jgi:septum formation inhibitor-activating ATPase MinD